MGVKPECQPGRGGKRESSQQCLHNETFAKQSKHSYQRPKRDLETFYTGEGDGSDDAAGRACMRCVDLHVRGRMEVPRDAREEWVCDRRISVVWVSRREKNSSHQDVLGHFAIQLEHREKAMLNVDDVGRCCCCDCNDALGCPSSINQAA